MIQVAQIEGKDTRMTTGVALLLNVWVRNVVEVARVET